MSRNNTDHGFYYRNGHQSTLMEVFQIRDQMLRRAVPKLELEWDMRVITQEISRANLGLRTIPVSLELILKNNSVVSARFPYLIVRVDGRRYAEMGPQYQQFAKNGLPVIGMGPIAGRSTVVDSRVGSQNIEFPGGDDLCIHPSTALRIAAVTLDAPVSIRAYNAYIGGPQDTHCLSPSYSELPTIIMEVSYGCLDSPCEKVGLELTGPDMNKKLVLNGLGGDYQFREGEILNPP